MTMEWGRRILGFPCSPAPSPDPRWYGATFQSKSRRGWLAVSMGKVAPYHEDFAIGRESEAGWGSCVESLMAE